MIPKELQEIEEEDLLSLIENEVLESRTLEYKKELPGDSKEDKIKFLANVSSFANADGGDIIYGIKQNNKTGLPEELVGLDVGNVDREIRRLEDMIRYGIEPRIIGIRFHPIKLSNSKIALIIRIPKSWIGPHRVVFNGHDKFYSRSANGKYPMDVSELRVAFNFMDKITEQIRRFREERIAKIYSGDTPVRFSGKAKVVLHLISYSSIMPGQRLDLSEKENLLREHLQPIHSKGAHSYQRYNFDGLLKYASPNSEGPAYSYVQLFKNGIIEAVEGVMLDPAINGGKHIIPGTAFEREIIESFGSYLDVLNKLGVLPPIAVFFSLLGVKDYRMYLSDTWLSFRENFPIDRDILLIPEVIINSFDVEPAKALKPIFDSVWNACGFPRCQNYDENGNWKGMK